MKIDVDVWDADWGISCFCTEVWWRHRLRCQCVAVFGEVATMSIFLVFCSG